MPYEPFSVTWDYLCPFARNAHEHLITALVGGAPWQVTFIPFSLMQTHIEPGDPSVWDQNEKAKGVLALQAGLVVHDHFPERFLTVHRALFAARHDLGRDIDDPEVITEVLARSGVPATRVLDQVALGWPMRALQTAHEKAANEHHVFGVPTFICGQNAVFVRLLTRPQGNAEIARTTIEEILHLIYDRPEINEFKYTSVPR